MAQLVREERRTSAGVVGEQDIVKTGGPATIPQTGQSVINEEDVDGVRDPASVIVERFPHDVQAPTDLRRRIRDLDGRVVYDHKTAACPESLGSRNLVCQEGSRGR